MLPEVIISHIVGLKDGACRITDTRVLLDSVILAYLRGETPEKIIASFLSLDVEQARDGIEFYLPN